MKTYTLHVPEGALPGDPEALDEAELVPDGFSSGAFVFSVLWFLVHRLWLGALIVLGAIVLLRVGLAGLGVEGLPGFLAGLLLAVLIGLEANSLRRWTLERKGRPAVGLVRAASRDEAEAKAFGRWLETGEAGGRDAPAPRAAPPANRSRPDRAAPVIGLFPEAERR